jgi:hypothetical protein
MFVGMIGEGLVGGKLVEFVGFGSSRQRFYEDFADGNGLFGRDVVVLRNVEVFSNK